MNEPADEQHRLQQLYASLSDGELLTLSADRSNLTPDAQGALAAEVAGRHLELPAEEPAGAPEAGSDPDDDRTLVRLTRFNVATDANRAVKLLEEQEVVAEIRPATNLLPDGRKDIDYTRFEVFVPKDEQEYAVEVLRAGMGWFPTAEVDDSTEDSDEEEASEFFLVGAFDEEADAELAKVALTNAGIWFRAEKQATEADEASGTPVGEATVIEVRFENVEQAGAVVEAAFPA